VTRLNAAGRGALGALILFAIGWQLGIAIRLGFPVAGFLGYFTNLCNLFAAFVLLVAAFQGLRGQVSPTVDLLRHCAVIYMAVVGIVFVTLLRDTDLGALLPWINVLLHYVVPVALVADWMLDPPARPLARRDLGTAIVFPLLFLIYTMIRGPIVGWYPYPFLDPATAGGYLAVGAYAAAIIVLFAGIGWVLTLRQRRLPSSRATHPRS
jgi:hypothetical protein